jgi:acyl-CoA thioester hydrolase
MMPPGAHTYSCPLRWGDMDAQGHVNNAAYLDYLQEARVHYLLSGPPVMQKMLDDGVLIVSHAVEYLQPLVVDSDPLHIELWVETVGASRFFIGYALRHNRVIVARARTGAVAYDLGAGRLRRLLPEERTVLEQSRDVREPLRPVTTTASHVTAPQATAHRHPVAVRWSDLDAYGHVNNVKFFDYVQEARIALLVRAMGSQPEGVWVIARQDIEYHKPVDFRLEPYDVRTSVAAVGRRSFTLAVEIVDPNSDTMFATARTVVVGQQPLTESARHRLRAWTGEGATAGRT